MSWMWIATQQLFIAIMKDENRGGKTDMYFGDIERRIYEAVKLPEDTKPHSITNETMGRKILEALRTTEEFQELDKILDYANVARWDIEELHYQVVWNSQIIAVVNTGGSEGIYIDWFLKCKNYETIQIGTLKTLQEGFDGYRKMGEICGMLVMATEAFIYENDDLFLKEEK